MGDAVWGERPIGMRKLMVLIRGLPLDSTLSYAMYPQEATWTVNNRLVGLVAEILANVYRPPNSPPVRILPHKRDRQTIRQFLRSAGRGQIVYAPDPPAASAAPAAPPDAFSSNGEKRGAMGETAPVPGGGLVPPGPESATKTFPSESDFVDDGGVVGVETPPLPDTPEEPA